MKGENHCSIDMIFRAHARHTFAANLTALGSHMIGAREARVTLSSIFIYLFSDVVPLYSNSI